MSRVSRPKTTTVSKVNTKSQANRGSKATDLVIIVESWVPKVMHNSSHDSSQEKAVALVASVIKQLFDIHYGRKPRHHVSSVGAAVIRRVQVAGAAQTPGRHTVSVCEGRDGG